MTSPAGTVATPVSNSAVGHIPVIYWGASQDVAFQASGGTAQVAGPFGTSLLRLALGAAVNARITRLDPSQKALSGSVLFVGPGVEFAGIDFGGYLSIIGDSTGTGTINITQAS